MKLTIRNLEDDTKNWASVELDGSNIGLIAASPCPSVTIERALETVRSYEMLGTDGITSVELVDHSVELRDGEPYTESFLLSDDKTIEHWEMRDNPQALRS